MSADSTVVTPCANPNVFSYPFQGTTLHADPLRVRRALLQSTVGKCWGIVKEVNRLQGAITECRAKSESMTQDLLVNPNTPEEEIKIAEINQTFLEGKQLTIPFGELPRVKQLEGYDVQTAMLSNRLAELEGILAQAAFEAFEFPEFDATTGEGTTEREAIEILKMFLEYAEGKGERLGS